MIGNSNSGKILLRKTLHSSHHDACAPSLSHKLKEVDPKFLFKPRSESPPDACNPGKEHHQPGFHQPCVENHVTSCNSEKWNPNSPDDPDELITVVSILHHNPGNQTTLGHPTSYQPLALLLNPSKPTK